MFNNVDMFALCFDERFNKAMKCTERPISSLRNVTLVKTDDNQSSIT